MTAGAPAAVIVEAGGIPMSALLREAPRPRAVILALHGGAVTSRYFDAPGQHRSSLLRTGAALGFTVVALDRPGYGSSATHAEELASAARRVDLAYAAVDGLLAGRPRGAGVFVVAHSAGCILAVRMAADARGAGLLGLELAGTGVHHHARARGAVTARLGTPEGPGQPRTSQPGPEQPGTSMRDLIWGPGHLYPAGIVGGVGLLSPAPGYEGTEGRNWGRTLPQLAARVRIPVRYSLGDHEAVWLSGPAALADVAAMFTRSPRVVVSEQVDGGHNLSLGRSALAYHLKVLSFAEECVLAREHGAATSGITPAAIAGKLIGG